jgi:hypothetical protein
MFAFGYFLVTGIGSFLSNYGTFQFWGKKNVHGAKSYGCGVWTRIAFSAKQ